MESSLEKIKIAVVSLGCDKNLVDSEVMLGLIHNAGYTITPAEEEAAVIIINTCGFILDATDEGIQTVLNAAKYKESGMCRALIVTGCMAQRYQEEIFTEIPEVDAVVGTGDFESITDVIKNVLDGKRTAFITDQNKTLSQEHSINRMLSTPGYFAYMKIAEGCDNHCTYCTIPRLRGKYRSRNMESLIEEGKILSEKGVKELILIAQDTALYGKDLYGSSMLHELIHKLSQISGIEWIRIMYCYPEHISDELIEEMGKNEKVCRYLDMPIQHAHDEILKKMGRRSNRKTLEEIINKLRKQVPGIALRTTLIAGFPGETKEQFLSLVTFIEEMKFDRLGVFAYSKEEDTPAYEMDHQLSEEEKNSRKEYLLEVQKAISAEKCAKRVGQVYRVLVEGKLPGEEVYCGRSYMDSYEVDGLVFFESSEEILSGEFIFVRITESSDYDLIGEVYHESAQ